MNDTTRIAPAAQLETLAQAIDACPLSERRRLHRELAALHRRAEAGRPFDRNLARLDERIEAARACSEARRAALPQPALDADLPVVHARAEIESAIAANQTVVLCGDTGSGKTTQLPQICLALGRGVHGLIGHTQPRRVAARSVAARIGEELRRPEAVGFKVRFADTVSAQAYVKLMTDGILLAEVAGDRHLLQYDTLIIDEAHERSLNIDFLLGYLKRLLPVRPELKLIITSATIDPERLATHFEHAPIVRVGGRSHPVEIRYREAADDDADDEPGRDTDASAQARTIADTVAGLWREGAGDVLVFLPTERDIRETAAALAKRYRDEEILPLYGRLSNAEQQRIFAAHTRRRIVLATNVAETSITVPGITYVIDTGTARISRYSVHSKVQRLPIEKISQASATQRAGRCGRLGPGVCVRLYGEADFLSRPEFTEPEILRTNLASVILQMQAAGLGEIEDFPFVDPPEQRYVNDGYRLLQELGACDERRRITALGRRLARLPVDPRLARVVLAAHEFGCLREALVIVAALSIQDPRERPLERARAADEAQADWADPRSDFLAFVRLWRDFGQRRKRLSGNKLRAWARAKFLSWVRLREWQDVHAQLVEAAKMLGLRANTTEADYASVHKALLTGFLTLVAQRDEDAYLAARNRRVHVFPGSALRKRKPRWLLAAEFAETSRVFARCVAGIEPAWIEQLGAHVIKRSYSDPRWDRKRGCVVATVQTSLYGLIVSARRKAAYAAVDAASTRELFLLHALARGELQRPPRFVRDNLAVEQSVHEMEARARRRDLLVDEDTRVDFYRRRIPPEVLDVAGLRRWLKGLDAGAQEALAWRRENLLRQAQDADAAVQFPSHFAVGANRLALEYHFAPGAAEDGVTLRVPLALLHELDPGLCEWLVPGLRLEKVTALIKGLPKSLRRNFVPAPDFAAACVQALPVAGSLLAGVAEALERMTGIACPLAALREVALAPHLRLRVLVLDEGGDVIDEGRDVAALQQRWRDAPASTLDVDAYDRGGVTRWDFDELPEYLDTQRGDVEVRVYPTLVAEADGVALRCFASAAHAAAALPSGLRELIKCHLRQELRYLRRNLPRLDEMCIWFVRVGSCERLREDLLDAAVREAFLDDVELPRERAAFEAMLERGRPQLTGCANALAAQVREILALHHALLNLLAGDLPLSWVQAAEDVRDQLGHLVFPGFVSATPRAQLAHLPRYLQAAQRRLEAIDRDPERDRLRRAELEPLWEQFKRLEAAPGSRHEALPRAQALQDLRWQLEELRVSLFAQRLGTAAKVSVARVEKALQRLQRSA